MDKNNFKNTCVFAICGALSVTLLGVSGLSVAKTVYASEESSSNINIELDNNLYNCLVALAEKPVENDTDNLYVYINGNKHKVVENEDGQLVIDDPELLNSLNGITDNEVPLSDIIDPSKYTIDENGNKVYHIVWGDTLSELALEFNKTVDELADHNSIENPDLIYADDYLYLP